MITIIIILIASIIHSAELPVEPTRMDAWPNPYYQQVEPDSRRLELESESTLLIIDFPDKPKETRLSESLTQLSTEYGSNVYNLLIYHDPNALQAAADLPLTQQLVFAETLGIKEDNEGQYQGSLMTYQIQTQDEADIYTDYLLEGKLRPDARFIVAPSYTEVLERLRVYISGEVIYVLRITQRLDFQSEEKPNDANSPQVVPPIDEDPFISQSVFQFK